MTTTTTFNPTISLTRQTPYSTIYTVNSSWIERVTFAEDSLCNIIVVRTAQADYVYPLSQMDYTLCYSTFLVAGHYGCSIGAWFNRVSRVLQSGAWYRVPRD